MALLWASTQVYADWASQISLVLGKPALEEADFAAAQALIVDMVLRRVLLGAGQWRACRCLCSLNAAAFEVGTPVI